MSCVALQQLYAPLNYFGSYYRTIQRQLIDMENCFELLATNAGLTVSALITACMGYATMSYRVCMKLHSAQLEVGNLCADFCECYLSASSPLDTDHLSVFIDKFRRYGHLSIIWYLKMHFQHSAHNASY